AYTLAAQSGKEKEQIELAARTLEPAGPSEALALAYMRLAALHMFAFECQLAHDMCHRALDVATAAGADAVRIWTYNFLGGALCGLGHDQEGIDYLLRSYREAVQRDLRWIAGNALHNLIAQHHWGAVLRARESLEVV